MSPTSYGGEERRHAPRYDVSGGEKAVLPVTTSVRILDISTSGVLVESTHRACEGARGRLRLDLGGRPFLAEIEVRRVSPAGSTDRYRIGAMFLRLSPEHVHTIERLTSQ